MQNIQEVSRDSAGQEISCRVKTGKYGYRDKPHILMRRLQKSDGFHKPHSVLSVKKISVLKRGFTGKRTETASELRNTAEPAGF
jgi:hypothetical protein